MQSGNASDRSGKGKQRKPPVARGQPTHAQVLRMPVSDGFGNATAAPTMAPTKSGRNTIVPARNHANRGSHPRASNQGIRMRAASQSSNAGPPNRTIDKETPIRSGISFVPTFSTA
jgi:hypothetical protein